MAFKYCFKLFTLSDSVTPYGEMIISPPSRTNMSISDFTDGEHFRTATENDTKSLILELEDRFLTLIVDESGSMTWNDFNKDRYSYAKRLVNKLEATYPGVITANLLGFGGVPVKIRVLLNQLTNDLTEDKELSTVLQETFQDSVYDFSGIRVVRRTDRYPLHPSDGVVVAEGIFDAVKDTDLTEGIDYFYGVWTYNKNNHFSRGRFVKSRPRDRILPFGVNAFRATVRILPAVLRDTNTKVIYNFIEGSGSIVFDSSGSGFHAAVSEQTILDSFWSGDLSVQNFNDDDLLSKKIGVRFDGIFDILEAEIDDTIAVTVSQSITVSFWIYRYNVDDEAWIIGTGVNDTTNIIGWSVGLSSDGLVGISLNNLSSFSYFSGSGNSVPLQTWTMVTVVFNDDSSTLYINGSNTSITDISYASTNTTDMTNLYIGAKPTDSNNFWFGTDFFGLLANLSIHNIARSSTYIDELYDDESSMFNRDIQSSIQSLNDNGQREVLLSWEIRNDFNYQNGRIKILRKYRDVPENDVDGDLVFEGSPSVGQFFLLDAYDFINNSDYYYRLFTVNSLGNTCDLQDSAIFAVHIPLSINSNVEIPKIQDIEIINGDRKLELKWRNPSSSSMVGTKIFFSTHSYPTIAVSSQGELSVTDGLEIADTTLEYFVHRKIGVTNDGVPIPLVNGVFHFYTLVAYDIRGRISEPVKIVGAPYSNADVVFPPEDVSDLNIVLVNPETLSIQWKSPIVRSDRLDLFFGDSAVIYVTLRDIFGGVIEDTTNIELQFCTSITKRGLTAGEKSLGVLGVQDLLEGPCGSIVTLINGGCTHGAKFNDDCNTQEEKDETIIKFSTVSDGVLKGVLTHTSNRSVLSRRDRYEMKVRARYKINDPHSSLPLFELNSEPVIVTFQHPLQLALINKDNRFVTIPCGSTNRIRGETLCPNNCSGVSEDDPVCVSGKAAGALVNSSIPYIVRTELQYKGGALPNGTQVRVALFKHREDGQLTEKSNRVRIREGFYATTSIAQNELNNNGIPTGNVINKSVVDIEIPAPSLPEIVDIYVSVDYAGLFVDGIQTISFLSSLFLQLNAVKPQTNGIDSAEQFATVWTIDPDNPDSEDNRLPVPDGTLVKWELIKLRFAKDRPFYSIEPLAQSISGVYSQTLGGVARNVFFGPISNIQSHSIEVCDTECCLGEEYAIKASVLYNNETAIDAQYIAFPCKQDEESFVNKKFLIVPADSQPGQAPNYVTWADGESLLHFQIISNPAISDSPYAECFRDCVRSQIGGQFFSLPENHIVQISAPGEILWNAAFEEDPYTGETSLVSSQVAKIPQGTNEATAGIPVTGLVTDFYIRKNVFIGDKNPKPIDCERSVTGDGLGSVGDGLLVCEWENLCNDVSDCAPTNGIRWDNVSPLTGLVTLISSNLSISLQGGGNYEDGVPPILIGFKEPLDVKIIEARVNGQRISAQELVVDGVSRHSFVVEVLFANVAVPDGVPVELKVEGNDANIVVLSDSVIYTTLVNDQYINPEGEKRSLAYFSINPLPNVAFNAKINVICRYDKVGTAIREVSRCVELNNTVNVNTVDFVPTVTTDPIVTKVTSNETIVYQTSDDTYRLAASGQINRIAHFSASVVSGSSVHIYNFGGFTDHDLDSLSGITPTSERFDTASETWSFVVDLPTPRAGGMTVIEDGIVYCIGGLEFNSLTEQYAVSSKIEAYDTSTGLWDRFLSSMPLGVAFGDAQVFGNNIYVTCGVNSVVNNTQPQDINVKIYRYAISSDDWEIIEPSNVNLYKRISPFAFLRSNPLPTYDSDLVLYTVYGGSLIKKNSDIQSEFNSILNQRLNDFRSFILTSPYFLYLTDTEQTQYLEDQEEIIRRSIVISPFVYPVNGFSFLPGSEYVDSVTGNITINILDNLQSKWRVLPTPRDRGQCVYVADQDVVYFLGGSNQNTSTTLNKVERIDLSADNDYAVLSSFGRGRALFSSVLVQDEIYISGGLTSGHKEGYVEIDIVQSPSLVEAQGKQSSGILITLKNDAGELIDRDVRCVVRGRVKIPEIDAIISTFLATRAADRVLGGDGSGNAPDKPQPGETVDFSKIIRAQNKITDPNSDEFQFNASKKLSEQIFLFPVLYNQQEVIIRGGIGGVTLLPRSEDPFADFQKLSQFIKDILANTPESEDERFQGDLTREELASLGSALDAVKLPPIQLHGNTVRELYQIETTVTILDDELFGQSVSEFDLELQENINKEIEKILNPPNPEPEPEDSNDPGTSESSGSVVAFSECFLLQHVAAGQIPISNTGSSNSFLSNPTSTGGFSQSGQCLFCTSLLPLSPRIRPQMLTSVATYYNNVDWIPQVKKRLVNGHTLSEVYEELDIIDHEVPFGSSQLYSSLSEAAIAAQRDDFESVKKSFYVLSDNSENLSLVTREEAIDEINAVDGDGKAPVVYVMFNTSFPVSLSAQLERTEVGDIEKIVKATGGQANLLTSSGFLDHVLNLTIGGATGGLGWGRHNRILEFDDLRAITDVTSNFILPTNTSGYFRFKYSKDGFNYTDFSEKFSGNQTVDFVDFFAKKIYFEVTLVTGFSEEITEEYDAFPTGLPKLVSLILGTSEEKVDYLFLEPITVAENVQQVASVFDGFLPEVSKAEIGVSTSLSYNWNDFQSPARPVVNEFGKIFLLDRTQNSSLDELEQLKTYDYIYYKSIYGPWDASSAVRLYRKLNNTEREILTGFVAIPRLGAIYFSTRQSPSAIFKLEIINSNKMRLGVRLSNRVHNESIAVRGLGYIYSTNDIKPIELSQVAPKAINVLISPESPTSKDTFFALYNYVDLNGDKESGSLISWFKNGVNLLEIENKTSWTNNDLLGNNKLEPNDKIFYSVRPSDGRNLGLAQSSTTVIIVPQSPTATNLSVISIRDNIIHDRFDTASIYRVQYKFEIDDSGSGATEFGTIIRWYVNGLLFKEGTYNSTEVPVNDPRELLPTDRARGVSAHIIGNQITVEVVPKTRLVTGERVISSEFVVVNTVPKITNVQIQPLNPTINSTLQVLYQIDDPDITTQATGQTDQSEIKWYFSSNGVDFVLESRLNGDKFVPPFFLSAHQKVRVVVTGFDGIDLATPVASNTVTILP